MGTYIYLYFFSINDTISMAKKRQRVPQSAEGETVMAKIEKLKIAKGNRLLVVTVTVKRTKKRQNTVQPQLFTLMDN